MSIKEEILLYLNSSDVPKTIEDITEVLDFHEKEDIGHIFSSLREMEKSSDIIVTKKGKFATPSHFGLDKGIYKGAGISGGGIVRSQDNEYYIPSRHAKGAMPGDSVLVQRLKNEPKGKREVAQVVKIIEKYEGLYTGIIYNEGRHYAFKSDTNIPVKVRISRRDLNGAQPADKVSVRLNRKDRHTDTVSASVVVNYGKADTLEANYKAILDYHNIKSDFPDDALMQAKTQYNNPDIEKELKVRKDLREHTIFTIDGEDALDLDDAVSIERTSDGYKLGVHIADVSYYVTHNSPLDKEAYQRGTSVYFADKVVPMLPKEISNGICSLFENQDRLALSCQMNIDREGNIKKYNIFKSVIRSVKKCTYSDINAIFDGSAGEDIINAYENILPDLNIMKELAQILYKKRLSRGALDFETTESKIVLDEDGIAIDVKKRESGFTQRLIEDFMLCANECVASHVYYMEAPFVYRIHEEPSSDKTAPFLKIASVLGYKLKGKNISLRSRTLQDIIEFFNKTPYKRLISAIALRSLMKAKYSPDCKGHYGLALKTYCHFTAPIRRYPDLVCHRILKHLISGEPLNKIEKRYRGFVQNASVASSELEIRAMNAERDIEDLFKAQYMSKYIGSEFDGTISSVTNFGFYVELDNTIEGLVRIASVTDDYYEFDEERLCFTGNGTKRRFAIGDAVKIRVIASDITTSNIDFELIID